MAKVLGIGGVFFKSADPAGLTAWYERWLGFASDTANSAIFKPDAMPENCFTVWSPFAAGTDYFAPGTREFMVNLIVDHLETALAQVAEGGAQVVGAIEEYDYGRFGWFVDPDGNKVELWEPPA